MNLAEKIDRAIELDKSMKKQKKELDAITAELQTVALNDMENKNIKQVQLFGTLGGNFTVTYKEKLEIDNYRRLVRLFGSIVKDKVTRKVAVKFEIDNRFKSALIILLKGDYKEHDIDAILAGMGLDDKKINAAKKKLKGDYKADKKTLESMGIKGDREEELDAIREAMNLQFIKRYFDLSLIDVATLKKILWLEETLSVSLMYDAESIS